ncbi:MAG: hypothetical protein GWM90_06915, partial [Gemmatimonadetes bacterium]|nr:hypothetical protein [Gemmatimonadota bacterium]NIQ53528.1 hypothetical protein [Gemmatimonadota bacterium]NIU73676.1 hypothetical protein [Gammaproteobacteria bacterium]NIX43847.1 hypothetical protein [Gemmatimonadota bacterium]NIY08051.1 hypothetical protein [Gemmatimonadota bacterium]
MVDDPDRTAAACPGCGALVPDPGGPALPHVGASLGCWAIYGDVLAREYGEWAFPPINRLTVNAYAAQHPGEPSPRTTQAMASHLVALYLCLERGVDPGRLARELGRVTTPSEFRWLDPPPAGSALTILDVRGAASLRDHTSRVERWAQ